MMDVKRPITLNLLTHTAGLGYRTGIARDQWGAAGIGLAAADRGEPIAAVGALARRAAGR
jgi:hypothetical protein